MSKLKEGDKFFDFSDYGRPVARIIASALKNTNIHAVHVTFSFLVCGILAMYCITTKQYILAGILLILKSILDAADGELSRVQNRPSYVGRFTDSIFDFIINLLLLYIIYLESHGSLPLMLVAFFGIELQGSLYNYYYTIQRTKLQGDTTSRIEEITIPVAFPYESQKQVNILFYIFTGMYYIFDQIVIRIDRSAQNLNRIPNWFMSMVSLYGLGFQLLLISILMPLGYLDFIIPFFVGYTFLTIVFVIIRKTFIRV